MNQLGENVVSIFEMRRKKAATKAKEESEMGQTDFNEIMKKNAENKKRLQESRLKSNKSVLNSYNLKK